jgi:large subunit ribosomal protein L16
MKGRCSGVAMNTELQFGTYGIQVLVPGRISARVLEACRRTMTRTFKRTGQVWIRVFPDLVVTAKPSEVRMGKGKGNPSYWAARVKKGQIIFEMDGISAPLAAQAARLVMHKMPYPMRFVQRFERV